jgi:AcrR family transcriptional regulator
MSNPDAKQLAKPAARRVGRPAQLDRDMIARAGAEIGLERVTMKAIADHLGVSVPGLYHHVRGRDELVRLAAEYAASQIEVPRDRGQHWTAWLLEWAQHARTSFTAQPELLGQFVQGVIGIDRMIGHVDAVVGLLTRQGFSPADALDAFRLVGATALGAAVGDLRQAEAHGGKAEVATYHRVLSERDPEDLPNLRALLSSPYVPQSFEEKICTVLIGIAVRRGEPWKRIPELAQDGTRRAARRR